MDVTSEQDRAWLARRVTIFGLGRHGGGVGAARFLAARGTALVTISDLASADTLAPALAALRELPIEAIHCGPHDPRDFREADCVVVNPAVRPEHACLQIARAAGAEITSEIELFLGQTSAQVIGVTGSNGKSTTATMLHDILSAAGRRTWLGGNIGGSLLGDLERIGRDDWVVLELSSFQLQHLSLRARWPELAVVTNCTPNHLDWHGTFADYAAAKQRLVRSSALSVLNPTDPESSSWAAYARAASVGWSLAEIERLPVAGEHNRENAALAAAAAEAVGVDRSAIHRALANFRGLEHRIELVGEVAGRRFYDDSKATSPRASIAALETLAGRLWLLAGGVSKGLPLDDWARAVVAKSRGTALFGASRAELAASIAKQCAEFPLHDCESLDEALVWCWRQSQPGDTILLSPACASFDQFADFTARGAAFRALVQNIDGASAKLSSSNPCR